MARPSKTSDNTAVLTIGGKERKAVIRWSNGRYVLLLSNHGRYNREIDTAYSVGVLLSAYRGHLVQN